MLIKIDINGDLYKQIEELVKEGKYNDLYDFVKIALNNQIQEEQSETSTDYTELKPIIPELKKSIKETEREIRQFVTGEDSEKGEISTSNASLIWTFYNRLFPVKIIVRRLTSTMINQNKTWISLEDLREEAFVYAEGISDQLKRYEDENEIGRNEKVSTGLPLPKSDAGLLKGIKKKKKLDKIAASELRFKEQFVGRFIKKDVDFKGACFELGLVRVKVENNECFLTLSDIGKEFTILENPILDNEDFTSNFSEEEIKFIVKNILSKFELENRIIQRTIEGLKTKHMGADEIDKIFQKYINEFNKNASATQVIDSQNVTAMRVSTMGRLSELKLVKWDIISGKSDYSLGKYA